MKKNVIIVCLMVLGSLSHSQVGINTSNPRGVFHVDGGKDNPISGSPGIAQQLNDFTVTSSGSVGIGTVSPGAKLEINNGTSPGALKLIDGTQGANKVLTSDVAGVATWRSSASITPTVLGVFPSATTIASNGAATSFRYSQIFIDLPRGKWIVSAGLAFTNIGATGFLNAFLSSAQNSVIQSGFTHLGPAGVLTGYGVPLTAATSSGITISSGAAQQWSAVLS